jgi:hypothetical protein
MGVRSSKIRGAAQRALPHANRAPVLAVAEPLHVLLASRAIAACIAEATLGALAPGHRRTPLEALPRVGFQRLTHLLVSSLVLRFVKDQFDDYRESTIGGASCRLRGSVLRSQPASQPPS